ncbi:MAG: Gfo/Idh/MocA family oxidoreductase, partial [Candidatus Neomarinimicrobiota bacterium]
MRVISVGVVGLGRIGKLHVNNILQMHDVEIVMVYDPFLDTEWTAERRLISVADEKSVYTSSKIDAILIFSPSTLHAGQIVESAKAGKHVFCEKPIALDPLQIEDVLSVVSERGIKLQIGFNRRFDPDFLKIRTAIADGLIGDLHLLKITARDPEPPPLDYVESSGGIFLDMTIHDFDMVRFLSGSEIREVYAKGAVLIDKSSG